MRIAVALFALVLAGCQSGPPTRGVPVAFNSVCEKANEGKRIMVEGYVNYPNLFHANDNSVMLRMRPSLALQETPLGINAPLGDQVNHVELPPEHFNQNDLKLHLADGQVVGYADKINVSGTMYFPSSMAQVEFKCGLSDTLYERSQ